MFHMGLPVGETFCCIRLKRLYQLCLTFVQAPKTPWC